MVINQEERRYVDRRLEDCNVSCNEAQELRELIKQGGLINHRIDDLVEVSKEQSRQIRLLAKKEDMDEIKECGAETRNIVDRYTHFFIAIIAMASILFSFIGWAFVDLSLVINYLELLNASRS